ncbi:MAG: amidohydrolase, partial [Saprospiraceae bacterium]
MHRLTLLFAFLLFGINANLAQVEKAPPRAEGDGPYGQLIIRGVTLINGNCAPPTGPVDIVVEQNRITAIR